MKENLKPCVYKLWERGGKPRARPRTFCRTVRRAARAGEVKPSNGGAAVKASVNSAWPAKLALQSARAGPKPGDLSMSRLKLP